MPEFFDQARTVLQRKFGSSKFSGRQIQSGDPSPVPKLRDRCQEVVFFRGQTRVGACPRRKDTRDLSPNNLLGGFGILHLLADSNAKSLAQ